MIGIQLRKSDQITPAYLKGSEAHGGNFGPFKSSRSRCVCVD